LSHIEGAVFMVCRVLVYQTRITVFYMINSTELILQFHGFWTHIISQLVSHYRRNMIYTMAN